MRNTQKKGFTLIELMIVISIIGILAITLLPQLQGAQERARDAGRIASLTSVEAILNTYYGDEGTFPAISAEGVTVAAGCLSGEAGEVSADLKDLFKGGKSPIDSQSGMISATCATARSFAYYPLIKNGIDNNGYLLIADMESYKKANYLITGTLTPTGMTFADASAATYGDWRAPTKAEDAADGKATVYAAIN